MKPVGDSYNTTINYDSNVVFNIDPTKLTYKQNINSEITVSGLKITCSAKAKGIFSDYNRQQYEVSCNTNGLKFQEAIIEDNNYKTNPFTAEFTFNQDVSIQVITNIFSFPISIKIEDELNLLKDSLDAFVAEFNKTHSVLLVKSNNNYENSIEFAADRIKNNFLIGDNALPVISSKTSGNKIVLLVESSLVQAGTEIKILSSAMNFHSHGIENSEYTLTIKSHVPLEIKLTPQNEKQLQIKTFGEFEILDKQCLFKKLYSNTDDESLTLENNIIEMQNAKGKYSCKAKIGNDILLEGS